MISNAVKKMALPRNNKLKKTAGENINSKSSFPRIASIVPTRDPPCFLHHSPQGASPATREAVQFLVALHDVGPAGHPAMRRVPVTFEIVNRHSPDSRDVGHDHPSH